MKGLIRHAHPRRRRLSLLVASAAFAVAGSNAAATPAHQSGSWLYPLEVRQKLDIRGYPGAARSGRGKYRFTNQSTPVSQQTWQFKHFECNYIKAGNLIYLCAHNRPGKKISISRTMRDVEYRSCTF